MADFRNYLVWQGAHALALGVYRVTESFPSKERYDLVRQIRRSASSVAANLSEGIGKRGDKEKARFVNIAIGSAYELDNHLQLAYDLGYLTKSEHAKLRSSLEPVRKMLVGFHDKLSST